MVKHIVMWKLKDQAEENDKSINKQRIKDLLFGLKLSIPEINTLEIGENFNQSPAAADLVLITTHKNKEALSEYINHPSHKEVAQYIGKVIKDRTVVDYKY